MTTEERDDWIMGLLADLDAVALPRPLRRRLRILPLPKKRSRKVRRRVFSRATESVESSSIAALSTCEPDSDQDVPPSAAVTKSNCGPPTSDVPELTITVCCRRGLPRWERRLPRSFTLAATPSRNSLILGVEVVTTDTQEILGLKALLDSGASGLFLHIRFVRKHGITTRTLSRPIPVKNVDGTANAAGAITEVVDLVLRYNGHSECVVFAVTDLGEQDMILGYTWLKEHNPEIDWAAGTVSMSRCPSRCLTCREEVKVERKARTKTRAAVRACRSGGVPAPEPELDDIPELFPDPDCEDDIAPEASPETDPVPDSEDADTMEEGDRLLATALFGYPAAEEIRASQTTSQRLAEAFARNSAPKDFRDAVPDYLHDFEDVFSKAAFDELPERKQWDHAIELEPGSTPSSCKVYPLAPNEQAELDAFLEENLKSGRIRPSKSPMHPVAFYSKSLNAVERNYEIHDKEMLAIIRALEEWRHFLEGARHKVEIYTDHKNLQYFLTAKKLNRRQARWSLYLANFDFVLHHRPGRSMGKPDALSRRPDHGDGSSNNADIVLLKPEFFAVRALQGLIAAGEENQILRDIRRGNREGAQEDVVAKAAAALKSARSGVRSVRSAEWSEDQGILMFWGRIYVPNCKGDP
ncbi:putative retrotransposable element tf2 155 kda protein type 1-like [Lyophyllum shimeji]|uniref:Retrotransposable element tf2 155 kDa protein type 1-like n=1 Tax=Lyophyllum shimeji TaxID=47721 RepID=A0A9P3UH72_LYOSH|nr:putative retrotransposable element tf2 155 kda protein type 1-like [Lyophyllum shimeji]